MIHIRRFTADDIDLGMSLKEQAGWNQLPGDWQRMLALEPDGGFVAEWNGQASATVMVTMFDDVAWISMMLVDASHRRLGLGRALMDAALTYSEHRGARTVRLDATPLGQPLYEQLGFTADYELVRYGGAPSPAACSAAAHPTMEEVVALDRQATGTNRQQLLRLLHVQQPFWGVLGDDALRGFVTARQGSHSIQIGPCAADHVVGPILLGHTFARYAGQPVVIDIPTSHGPAIAVAEQHGLTAQRMLLRMTRGQPVRENTDWLWASFGPEKG